VRSSKAIRGSLLFCSLAAIPLSSLRSTTSPWISQQELFKESSCPKKEEVSQIFKTTRKLSRSLRRPSKEGSLPCNKGKNAHRGVIPFDDTRTLRSLPNFYINANDIKTPCMTYIAAQAPIENSLSDFWKMILLTKPSAIITLCMPQNAGNRHVSYWKSSFLPVHIEEWTITKDSHEYVLAINPKAPSQRLVLRTFIATDQAEVFCIPQIHYENWPDFGPPDPDLFTTLLDYVDQHNFSSPLLVHCSAGIGRTGTFIAAHSIRKELKNGKKSYNFPLRILELRRQRPHMVSSAAQCQAIYQAVSSLQKLLLQPETLPEQGEAKAAALTPSLKQRP